MDRAWARWRRASSTPTGQLDKQPSLVSSALVRDPDIGYVHVAFDVTVQSTIQGIQSSGRTDVKVASRTASCRSCKEGFLVLWGAGAR